MNDQKTTVNPDLTKEQAILYYLFVDEQLLGAWWDYLEFWNDYKLVEETPRNDPMFVRKMEETMDAVEYWEDILDQLKTKISFQDIEDYIAENPNASKGYLFIK